MTNKTHTCSTFMYGKVFNTNRYFLTHHHVYMCVYTAWFASWNVLVYRAVCIRFTVGGVVHSPVKYAPISRIADHRVVTGPGAIPPSWPPRNPRAFFFELGLRPVLAIFTMNYFKRPTTNKYKQTLESRTLNERKASKIETTYSKKGFL